MHLRHWIFGLPSSQPFARVAGTDLWYLTLELPRELARRVQARGRRATASASWIEDPLNPHRARDPFGANSVVHGDGYETPEWTQPDPEARPGALDELRDARAARSARRRAVTIYLPARFRRTRRYPLLVVHDGDDYLQLRGLEDGARQPDPPARDRRDRGRAARSPRERLREYADDEPATRASSTEELVPRLERDYPLRRRRRQARGLMGASFGAVASLVDRVALPGRSSGGCCCSRARSRSPTSATATAAGPLFDPVVAVRERASAHEPARVAERVFVSCGIYESLIYENRSLVPLLQSTGMDVRYVEARDGHNWENWRDRLREGLSWLFPGPLWMVYE